MYLDTQLIRNAYLERPSADLAKGFGAFACEYLGVTDNHLRHIYNTSGACNYIIAMGYNREGLSCHATLSEPHATTEKAG